MPISLEPDKRFPIVLESDACKPKDLQPTFYANTLSMRASERIVEEFDDMIQSVSSPRELHGKTCEMLHQYVVGWKNMGSYDFPKSAEEWHNSEVISWAEATELLRKVIANRDLTDIEKKS